MPAILSGDTPGLVTSTSPTLEIDMERETAAITPRYLRTPDAAVHLGLSPRTLEKHRCFGTGPIFRKLGGRIVYALVDLEDWAEIGRRRSTSDPGRGTVHPAKRIAAGDLDNSLAHNTGFGGSIGVARGRTNGPVRR